MADDCYTAYGDRRDLAEWRVWNPIAGWLRRLEGASELGDEL
jgi:hypothetical protein